MGKVVILNKYIFLYFGVCIGCKLIVKVLFGGMVGLRIIEIVLVFLSIVIFLIVNCWFLFWWVFLKVIIFFGLYWILLGFFVFLIVICLSGILVLGNKLKVK